jgi:hypothetical protein
VNPGTLCIYPGFRQPPTPPSLFSLLPQPSSIHLRPAKEVFVVSCPVWNVSNITKDCYRVLEISVSSSVLTLAVTTMSSPILIGVGAAVYRDRLASKAGDAMMLEEKPVAKKSSIVSAAARSTPYSSLQQQPGFHQFKLERPPPAAHERLKKTCYDTKDGKPYIDDAGSLEVGMRSSSPSKHKSHKA